MHLFGHYHRDCVKSHTYAHFISRGGDLTNTTWDKAADLGPANGVTGSEFTEPVPVPTSGDGIFGAAVADTWIDFVGFQLIFQNVSWIWVRP